jgi:hypothetical protein
VPPVFRKAMGDYTVLLRTPDFAELQQMIAAVQQTE